MQPLPEIRAQLDQLTLMSGGDVDMAELLSSIADLAVAVVPSCVGVSITIGTSGTPMTITATSEEFAVVDAVQYLDGGPCVDCMSLEDELFISDMLDEKRWHLAAQAAAAKGIRSSLSMPLRDGADVIGALNLYASEPNSFDHKEKLIVGIFGARLDEIITNADLSFMTRDFARELPERLAEAGQVDEAVGMLMARHGWGATEARQRLKDAATRAGVSTQQLASVLVELVTGDAP